MTSLDRLTLYLQEAIQRTTAKEYQKVSAALIPVLPDLVNALKQVTTDADTTAAQRLRAAEMLMMLWTRCLRDEDRRQTQSTNRQRIRANKPIADAEIHKQFIKRLTNMTDGENDLLFKRLQAAYDRRKAGK
jgi:5'-deoxynucleotidase YfbR-like HD superfamily hydrolase